MRESGILMHITSLPSPYGIGTMGKCAFHFVDFLEKAGQSCWQILPLNPTGFGDSPYQSFSTFAGNPYLIDLDRLTEEGLLEAGEAAQIHWGSDPGRVDFGTIYKQRGDLLYKAFKRFSPSEEYTAFLQENASWLPDYAMFMALKEANGGKPWLEWPEELCLRHGPALEAAGVTYKDRIDYQCFVQFLFFRQWKALRSYANSKGIRIIGDVPIYVPLDSADVWVNYKLFQLDETRRPTLVAGCPPDGFTADGQLWGNPIYNWQAMAESGYAWWIHRLGAAAGMYDVVRFDHFRGFESYWAIPAGDKTACNGSWVKGPGMDFIHAVQKALPELDFIAEDLGFITNEVRQMQVDSGYPGMKILEFAFDSREESDYLPHLYPVESVCYTGTHDNVTLKQWFDEASPEDQAYAIAYLGLHQPEGMTWGMIRGGMGSVSRLFVAQMQDYLELGGEARMNTPGMLSSANWTWRAQEDFDSDALAARIYKMAAMFGRLKK